MMKKLPSALWRQAARRTRRGRRALQRGFTLVEMLMVMAVIAVVTAMIAIAYNGSSSKGLAMVSDAQTLAQGFLRAKQDMGCYPNAPSVLWSGTLATAGNMVCGVDGTQVWDGPYVNALPTDAATGDVELPGVSAGVLATIASEATPATSLGVYYFIHVIDVPNDIVTAALLKCNGSKATTATFQQGSCRGTLGAGAGALGTFDYKIEETSS
ncbi:type II secretion system protein [Pandoraea sp.]|uniref:type II secretion system protein n=1 Tax=Pandoraea sp. TaxID=1883445 RepID=UPI001209F28F|nr:prepilin-type N-terminal cleavage/methylation domain-containing protein [Pandoraea sp.]TAL56920.1 MAG: prepilin-type N-terminal cleavage/methylation domain-containing protein [Pandoraea sp.]TAM17714.1 MAG: prepilin-type N-terminal cleavage/methylation domain-containing protein [Pandoraea sp.]